MQRELPFLKIIQLSSPVPAEFQTKVYNYLAGGAGRWGYDAFYGFLYDYICGSPLEGVVSRIALSSSVPFKNQKSTYIKRLREIDKKVDFSAARHAYQMKKSTRIELGGLTMKIPQNIQYTTEDGPKMLISLFDKHSELDDQKIRLALGIINEEVNSTTWGENLSPELICFDNDILRKEDSSSLSAASHEEVMDWYRYCLLTLRDIEAPVKESVRDRVYVDPKQLGLDL